MDVNDQGLKMFGYTREEMNGREITHHGGFKFTLRYGDGAIQNGIEEIYGHKLIRKDGSRFFGEARSKNVTIGERRLRMTALRDITERLDTERALRESEEKFSKAFRTGPDVMSITDYETNCYLEVNDAHERIFGFKRDEVIGHTPAELGIFKNPPRHGALHQALKEKGSVHNEEIRGSRTRWQKEACSIAPNSSSLAGACACCASRTTSPNANARSC